MFLETTREQSVYEHKHFLWPSAVYSSFSVFFESDAIFDDPYILRGPPRTKKKQLKTLGGCCTSLQKRKNSETTSSDGINGRWSRLTRKRIILIYDLIFGRRRGPPKEQHIPPPHFLLFTTNNVLFSSENVLHIPRKWRRNGRIIVDCCHVIWNISSSIQFYFMTFDFVYTTRPLHFRWKLRVGSTALHRWRWRGLLKKWSDRPHFSHICRLLNIR